MGIDRMDHQMGLQGTQAGKRSDRASIERKLEQLRKQLEQIKENKQLPPQEKEKRIRDIQKQIEELEKQRAEKQQADCSVRAEKVQDIEKAMQEEQAGVKASSTALKSRFDTFEHGSETQKAGVYAFSRDDEGNPVIEFDDPEASQKSPSAAPQDASKPQIVKTTVNTDAVEREIEKLKKSFSETKQRLAAASEPREKELLENKLTRLEAELKQKDNDTYRRQHMQITEQTVVSEDGE